MVLESLTMPCFLTGTKKQEALGGQTIIFWKENHHNNLPPTFQKQKDQEKMTDKEAGKILKPIGNPYSTRGNP